MKTFTLNLTLSAAALLVLPAPGQTGQPAQAPVFQTNAAEISLNLVVHNKKDKPVVDLKPEEIAVSDNGSPMTLTSLRLVSSGSESEHLITLLFDPLQPDMMKRARNIAVKVLKVVPEKGFSIAVLEVGGRLRLQQGFTSDRRTLEQAVSTATEAASPSQSSSFDLAEKTLVSVAQTGANPSGAAVSAFDRALSQTLLSAIQDSGRIVQDQHGQPYLAGLLALVQSQQRIKQQKAVIYFTRGQQMDSRARELLVSIGGAANRSGVSIYIIDLDAIDQGTHEEFAQNVSMIGSTPGTVQGATGMQKLPSPTQVFTEDVRTSGDSAGGGRTKSPIQSLAEATGGGYISSEDSLRKPLAGLIQDMTTYYEASYVPGIQQYDGKFHSVEVKPLRAGLRIRSNAGYFALPADAGAGIRPFEMPLLKILAEPKLPADLAFHATVLRLGDLPARDGNALVIEAPLSGVAIHEDVNTHLYSAHLSIVAQIKDRTGTVTGTVIEHFSEDVPRRGALEAIEAAKSEVVTLQHHFIAPPGEYVLEAAILDGIDGKAGAQRIAFQIPQPSGGPSLSDLVLVRRMQPFADKDDPLEPLMHGNDRVTPNLSGETSRDAKEVSVFFITHPEGHASAAVTLQTQWLRDGEPLNQVPVTTRQTSGDAAATHLITLPIRSLPESLYELKVTLSQGGKTAEATLSFNLPAERPDSTEGPTAAPMLAQPTGTLAITFPTGPVEPQPPNELKSILVDATKRALDYSALLPNFLCIEVTNRSVDPRGDGKWKHQDRMTERLTYRDKAESRTMIEVEAYGKKSQTAREDLKGWLSHGEFGGMLKSVFQPSSKADFHWVQTGTLGDGTIQLFDYRVTRENSNFDIHWGLRQATIGFHGKVFIETATRSVRRITMVADDVPKDFPIHAASLSVDYDYIVINDHDYLLPVDGQVSLRQGRREAILNEIEFRNYRRFGSSARILDYSAVDAR